jgi:hypothetical protein
MRYVFLLLFTSLLCLTALGCGSSGPDRAPVRGQVKIAGQPLKQGRILFAPLAPNVGPTASAVVVNGEYQLPAREGAVVGPNRVQVEATPDLGFALDDEAAYARRGAVPMPPDPIPPEFGKQSQLTLQVVESNNQFDIQIPEPARRW